MPGPPVYHAGESDYMVQYVEQKVTARPVEYRSPIPGLWGLEDLSDPTVDLSKGTGAERRNGRGWAIKL